MASELLHVGGEFHARKNAIEPPQMVQLLTESRQSVEGLLVSLSSAGKTVSDNPAMVRILSNHCLLSPL
jgi:hypothetical protein